MTTAPQWRAKPTVPGLWVWLQWGQKPHAWKFSAKDVDEYRKETGMVYGPIPEPPKDRGAT